MENTQIYIKLNHQRECFKKYHEMSVGITEEEVYIKVEKSMEIWFQANPEFIPHLEIDLEMFSNKELELLMDGFAAPNVENYEKCKEIKDFMENR